MRYCPACTTEFDDAVEVCPTHQTKLQMLDEWGPGAIVKGSYRIVGKIGRGGMGIVYRAQHTSLHDARALKVMRSDLAADPQFSQRFLQEAHTAIQLLHPHSVRIFDLGQSDDGKLFIAMEYIEGVSVRELLGRGYLFPPTRAVEIARQVADALAAAHALGIVHRDLKPDNIMITRNAQGRDHAKVMDFGIAAVRETSLAGRLTQPGTMVGTGAYSSPEQLSGSRALDGRADLYSLGITLYEMLSGHPPFEAATLKELSQMVLSEPLPPLPAELRIPAPLEDLLRRLTAKDPDHRIPNALEVIRELHLLQPALSGDPGSSASTVVVPLSGISTTPNRPSTASRPFSGAQSVLTPAPEQVSAGASSGRKIAAIASAFAVLALAGLGFQSFRLQKLELALHGTPAAEAQQLTALGAGRHLAHRLTLLTNSKFMVCNVTSQPFQIVHLASVWRDPQDHWQTFNSDFHGYKNWTVQPGERLPVTFDSTNQGSWDGSVLFYAVSIQLPDRTGTVMLAGPWSETDHGCLTPHP